MPESKTNPESMPESISESLHLSMPESMSSPKDEVGMRTSSYLKTRLCQSSGMRMSL